MKDWGAEIGRGKVEGHVMIVVGEGGGEDGAFIVFCEKAIGLFCWFDKLIHQLHLRWTNKKQHPVQAPPQEDKKEGMAPLRFRPIPLIFICFTCSPYI